MSFVKMRFICDQVPNNMTLHCLYTSIRYSVKKEDNSKELFQVWNDGRTIFIVMDENLIEKDDIKNFSYRHNDGSKINIKLVKKEQLITESFKKDEYVYVKGIISHAYKHYDNLKNKCILSCPINIKGKFKDGLKTPTFEYLEKFTGLSFNEEKNNDTIRFERIFMDEFILYDYANNRYNKEKKILFRNIISIDAIVKINDEELFDNVLKGSIGKKKSYGFGKLFIEKI